jgi:hypothetical protein
MRKILYQIGKGRKRYFKLWFYAGFKQGRSGNNSDEYSIVIGQRVQKTAQLILENT